MTDDATGAWRRRDLLAGLALLGLAVGPAAAAVAATRQAEGQAAGRAAPHQALLREVAQLVIPRTATPGAGEVGVGAFVLLALEHGLEGTRRPMGDAARAVPAIAGCARPDGSLDHARWLAGELDRRAGGSFATAPLAKRQAALAALDHDAFADVAAAQPWHPLKALILIGYYASETGGSRELAYELVPGRFDPDLPVTPATRAYSSDWTAIDFG